MFLILMSQYVYAMLNAELKSYLLTYQGVKRLKG